MKQRDLNDTLIFWHRLQMFKFANNAMDAVADILIWVNKVLMVGNVMFAQVQELSISRCPKMAYNYQIGESLLRQSFLDYQ